MMTGRGVTACHVALPYAPFFFFLLHASLASARLASFAGRVCRPAIRVPSSPLTSPAIGPADTTCPRRGRAATSAAANPSATAAAADAAHTRVAPLARRPAACEVPPAARRAPPVAAAGSDHVKRQGYARGAALTPPPPHTPGLANHARRPAVCDVVTRRRCHPNVWAPCPGWPPPLPPPPQTRGCWRAPAHSEQPPQAAGGLGPPPSGTARGFRATAVPPSRLARRAAWPAPPTQPTCQEERPAPASHAGRRGTGCAAG